MVKPRKGYAIEAIGARIRLLRLTRGLSQAAFGLPVGLRGGAISTLEHGRRVGWLDTYQKIADHYEVALPWLLFNLAGPHNSYTLITDEGQSGDDDRVIDVRIESIRKRLLQARQTMGLSQEAAAVKAGLHPNTIALWEVDDGIRPRLEKLIAYADGLEINPCWLVLGLALD